MGSAVAGSGSCAGPGIAQRLEPLDLMAAHKGEEALGAVAVREVAAQQASHRARHILRLDIAKNLARKRGVRSEAAADQDVIALDGVAIVRRLHPAGEEADVADVMLRAGVMAAG